MSAKEHVKVFSLQPGGSSRKFNVAKFRDPVNELCNKSGKSREMRIARAAPRSRDPELRLDTGSRVYEGEKEMVGTSSLAGSCYAIFELDSAKGIIRVHDVNDWYSFRPEQQYAMLSTEDAELALSQGDHRGRQQEERLNKLRRDDGITASARRAAELAEEIKAAEEMGIKLSKHAIQSEKGATVEIEEEEDEFDDGADPEWNGGGANFTEEDGRDGLDVEDDDAFDDDDDDAFEEDDVLAMGARQDAKRWASSRAGASQVGAGEIGVDESGDVEIEEGDAEESEWSKKHKEALKAQSRMLRQAAQQAGEIVSDEEEDDQSNEDDVAEMLHEVAIRRNGGA